MSPRRLLASAALALAAFAGTGCGDATGLDENDIDGFYEAVQLTVVEGGFSEDVIDDGGYMELLLSPDGTTEGEIYIRSENLFVDLQGEWEVRNGRVYVSTFEDTFLNDAPLEIESRSRLTMDRTFGTSRVILDLRRTADF